MTRPELRPLTSVRGLFAWAVVLYHLRLACTGWLPMPVIHVLAKGYLAVDFFFLLSGFVIWLNYGERLRTRGAALDFLVRRIARVWPLHAALLVFAAGIATLLLVTGRAADHFPFALLPLHLAMMQDWGFSNALMWNDPAWSISCEWAAYLLAALIVPWLPARRWPTALLVMFALLPLCLLHAVLASAGTNYLGYDIPHFGIVRCLTEFSCGALLSTLWTRWRGRVGAEIGCWIAGLAALGGWTAGLPETLAVPLAFAAMLLGLALGGERPRHPLAGRAIHFMGEISYATYLSHYLLFFTYKLFFVRNEHDVPPIQIALFLTSVLIVSILLYDRVERPAQRAILRHWSGRRERRTPIIT